MLYDVDDIINCSEKNIRLAENSENKSELEAQSELINKVCSASTAIFISEILAESTILLGYYPNRCSEIAQFLIETLEEELIGTPMQQKKELQT